MADRNEPIVYRKLAATRLGSKPTPFNAVVNLLRKDVDRGIASSSQPKLEVNRFTMDRTSRETAQEAIDSDAVMQTLPDLELVKTVVIGSTLDPKSMNEPNLIFNTDRTIFDCEIGGLLLKAPEKYFKQIYKIDDHLDKLLEDPLFTKGSSVLCVLPENQLDNLINGRRQVSYESFDKLRAVAKRVASKGRGYLGPSDPSKISVEDFQNDPTKRQVGNLSYINVTDEPDVLKLPNFNQRSREMYINNSIHKQRVSVEAEMHRFTDEEINRLYNATQAGAEPTQVMSNPKYMDRPSVGHPLIVSFPPESVVPVFEAGRPYKHLGYFLLVDHNGYPVCKDATRDFYGEMQSGWKSGASGENNSEVLRLTREAMGDNSGKVDYAFDQIQRAHSAIIESEVNNMLRNGMYDQELEIGLSDEARKIMLYRNWKAKTTTMVYIPVELLVYIAFDYNNRGVGQTLISRTKIISTIRTVLLFAETMGGIRNAVGRKRVSITTDPNDPDPEYTIDGIQSLIIEQGMRSFPIAAPDPGQTMDALVRSAYDFNIESNGAAYANTKVQYDDYNTQISAGNPELQDRIRRMHYSSFGIPPEKVDPMSSPDFATSIVQNDLVASRKVKERQKAFCGHLTKLVRVFTMHSSILREEMYRIVKDNHKMISDPDLKKLSIEEIVDEFISSMYVELPAPDNTQHERQLDSLELYERILEKGLSYHITPEMYADDYTGVPGLAEDAQTQLKAGFMRQFMAANNILPELDALAEMDGETPAFSMLDLVNTRHATMTKALLEYAKYAKLYKERLKKQYAAVIDDAADEGFGGGDDSGGDYGDMPESTDMDSDYNDQDLDETPPEEDTDMDELSDPIQAEANDQGEAPEEPEETI